MDVLGIAKQRRAAVAQELERLDAWMASNGRCSQGGVPSGPVRDPAQILPFRRRPPRVIRQYPAERRGN